MKLLYVEYQGGFEFGESFRSIFQPFSKNAYHWNEEIIGQTWWKMLFFRNGSRS